MSKDPLKIVEEMVSRVGQPKAERLLIEHEISPSMAYKLVRGEYDYKIRAIYVAAIEKAHEASKAS
jgi:hypothetical protein